MQYVNGSARSQVNTVMAAMKRIQRRVTVSARCREAHPFLVKRGEPSGEVLGRFASLYCAAQTALFNDWHKHDGTYVPAAHVVDERSGQRYERAELMGVDLRSIVPLTFIYGGDGTRTAQQTLTELDKRINAIYGK